MIKPCGLVCVLRTRSLSTIKFFNKTGHNAPSPPSPSSSSSLSAPSQLLPASSLFAPLPPSPVSQPRLPVRLAPPPTPLSSPPRTSLLPCPRGLRSSLFANYCLLPPPPPCMVNCLRICVAHAHVLSSYQVYQACQCVCMCVCVSRAGLPPIGASAAGITAAGLIVFERQAGGGRSSTSTTLRRQTLLSGTSQFPGSTAFYCPLPLRRA